MNPDLTALVDDILNDNPNSQSRSAEELADLSNGNDFKANKGIPMELHDEVEVPETDDEDQEAIRLQHAEEERSIIFTEDDENEDGVLDGMDVSFNGW